MAIKAVIEGTQASEAYWIGMKKETNVAFNTTLFGWRNSGVPVMTFHYSKWDSAALAAEG